MKGKGKGYDRTTDIEGGKSKIVRKSTNNIEKRKNS